MENNQTEQVKQSAEKVKKKPFKQTRELVKLALHNGWTQTEIAKTCRTQQSVVSAWSKGEKLGTEQQLKPLLDLFGYKLRRNTFKLYWGNSADNTNLFFKIEGKIIFNFSCCELSNYFKDKPKPKLKFIVHQQGNDNFMLVILIKTFDTIDKELNSLSWRLIYLEKMNISELLNFADNLTSPKLNKIMEEQGINFIEQHLKYQKCDVAYQNSLPFLIRQALLNHGFSVENIIEHPASW